MQTIKAAVCHAPKTPLIIEDILLSPPGPDQVEVTLEAVAICHSDISFIDGAWSCPFPAVFGHEAVGHITATGPGARASLGARVIVTLLHSCGTCQCCATGAPAHCETSIDRMAGQVRTMSGDPIHYGINCAAFAEKVVVHQSQIASVPASIPAASASLLACGVVTGIGAAVNTAGVRPGETVVVIGAGGVGLNAIQGARIAGASRIIAVDMLEEKLTVAREFGATDGILASTPEPWNEALKIAPRGADVVLVTVGAVPAYESALGYLGQKGRMYMVGMTHSGQSARYEPVNVCAAGQRMEGSLMGDTVLSRDIPWMIDMYSQGRLKLDELVSATWRLDQINEAIASTKSGAARRNVIVF
ncbi:MAG: S-(hydroxymethyl)glutathione dehydrogenase/alcohol dehydrogenase [Paracoccaceae bacterium]|jgi:Zn-dependent alcohol dehydrogenase